MRGSPQLPSITKPTHQLNLTFGPRPLSGLSTTDRTRSVALLWRPSGACAKLAGMPADPHIREAENGWDFDLAILMLAAMLCVLGLGILYLAERDHAPEQSRMIDTGAPDFE